MLRLLSHTHPILTSADRDTPTQTHHSNKCKKGKKQIPKELR